MASSAYSTIPPEEEDPSEVTAGSLLETGLKRKKWPFNRSIFIHGGLILLYTAISLAVIRANSADELSSHGGFIMAQR